VKVCRQCVRPWLDTYEERKDPRGRPYFWNSSIFTLGATGAGHRRGRPCATGIITVTPLQFDLTQYQQLKEWQGREWKVASKK